MTNEICGASRPVLSRRTLLKAGGALAAVVAAPTWVRPRMAAAAPPTTLRTVMDWEQGVLEFWDDEQQYGNPWFVEHSLSGDSYQQYYVGYGVEGATALAQATGKAIYLKSALEYSANLVATAVVSSSLPASQWQDSYLAWPSSRSGHVGEEVPLDESICWRSITRMLTVIRDTPAWYGDPAIRSEYDALLEFSEVNIFEKWYMRDVAQSPQFQDIYRARTHMASHWAYISLNLSRLTTSAMRRTRYQEVLDNIDVGVMPVWGSSLRDQMIIHPDNPDAYFWSDVWGSYQLPGSDVFHGSHDIDFITEAHDAGVEWTATDIQRFVVLLDKIVWPTNEELAKYVDGSGLQELDTMAGMAGFCKLGRYDPSLQQRLDSFLDAPGRRSYVTIEAYGDRALNARRLGVPYGYSREDTVSFEGSDSKVRNVAREDGWTIQDAIWANGPYGLGDHGRFVRDVSDVTAVFRSTGLIDSRQRAAVVRAAAGSSIGRAST
jgi:hypothetical protein